MEYVLDSGPNQTEYIGGVLVNGSVKVAIPIRDLDSILVGFSPGTVVKGLDQVPQDERPPSPTLLHLAFDAMVGIGTLLLGLGAWFGLALWRRRSLPRSRWFWRAASVAGIAAVTALECGWVVTEVGRQPWIAYRLMRTADAVTTARGIWISLTLVVLLYAALGAGVVLALRALSRRWRREELAEGVPYGPRTSGTA